MLEVEAVAGDADGRRSEGDGASQGDPSGGCTGQSYRRCGPGWIEQGQLCPACLCISSWAIGPCQRQDVPAADGGLEWGVDRLCAAEVSCTQAEEDYQDLTHLMVLHRYWQEATKSRKEELEVSGSNVTMKWEAPTLP